MTLRILIGPKALQDKVSFPPVYTASSGLSPARFMSGPAQAGIGRCVARGKAHSWHGCCCGIGETRCADAVPQGSTQWEGREKAREERTRGA